MHDERLAATDTSAGFDQDKVGAKRGASDTDLSSVRDRHTRNVVLGLTGLLGAAWAMVVAIRYADIIPH